PISKDGQSLERIPANSDRNQASDWHVQPTPQPGKVNLSLPTPDFTPTTTALPPSCNLATLLISEVLYDPSHSIDPVGEWIEVFNWGESSVYLGCLLLGDEETMGGGEGMFTFPPELNIQAGEVIVIANRATDFSSIYGFDPDYEFVESNPLVPDMVKFKSWAAGSVNLSNSGDDVLLVGVDENLIDAVSWGNSIFAFDPSVPSVGAGRSIARQPADLDSNSAQDWLEQIDPQPGIVELDPPIPPPNHTSTSTAIKTKKPTTLPPSPTKTPTRTRTPTPTKTPTRTPTPSEQPLPLLVINEIHADPHSSLGDANYDGVVDTADDEFVEFVNDSQSSLDISGWTLGDALDHRHTFPPGSIIAPHCGIVIFGGGAPNGVFGNNVVQIASSGNLGLNDHGDIIYLYDTTMEIIISITYGEEAGDDQSITRDPDIIGEEPLRKHSLAIGSNGSLFSPGTKVDGSYFSGCSER
ncbi:MAG: lamin tail domain-containing protein, partial [Chloroflexi bacterium]|nr:lamin tail domain-containing protein [Chloroflexota bacterium]